MYNNIVKNTGEIWNNKNTQKLLNQADQSATDSLKTALKEPIKKNNKLPVIWLVIQLLIKLQKFKKERYVSPEERERIIDEVKLI